MMMTMRWRASSAATAAVVRRPLWTQLASRAPSTLDDEEEEDTTDAPRKRIYTAADKRRAIASKAKETSENAAREFAILPSALQAFHQKAGHFIVPLNLQCVSIPQQAGTTLAKGTQDKYTRVYGRVQGSSEIDWPKEALAEKLNIGQVLCKLMKNATHRQNHPEVISELRAMGFPVEEAAKDWRLFVWNHQVLPALETYHKLKGDSMVCQSFVVPRGDPLWPETTWGIALGKHVRSIRHQMSDYAPEQLEDLERLGFSSNVSQTEWDTRILPSFKVFAKHEGHGRIPQTFIVPSRAPYPKKAWGMKLGEIVATIRCKNIYAKQVLCDAEQLKSLGFQYSMPEYMWRERILPSLQVFKKVYGHCDVPRKFVVPSEAPWPKEAWGDKLGYCVQNIRSRGDYADQLTRDANHLDAIGFVWKSANNKWSTVILPALEIHHKLYGDSRISKEFVVPSEEPWPTESWGFKLGMCVKNMKYRSDYAKQRQQDEARLQAMGLDFLIPS